VPTGLDEAAIDAHNERLMHAANATGEIFLSHTKLDGKFVLRLAIGNLRTTQADVETAWRVLREAAR
jgi:aromatic-L-amino-acid decarboxylase